MILSFAATKKTAGRHTRVVCRYDVSVAFFHAKLKVKICVIPPKGLVKPGWGWALDKAMYGTREAAQAWGQLVTVIFIEAGFEAVLVVAMTFYHSTRDISVTVHGDDFLGEGEPLQLDWLDELMREKFEVKILPRIGPPELGGISAGKHLNCTI